MAFHAAVYLYLIFISLVLVSNSPLVEGKIILGPEVILISAISSYLQWGIQVGTSAQLFGVGMDHNYRYPSGVRPTIFMLPGFSVSEIVKYHSRTYDSNSVVISDQWVQFSFTVVQISPAAYVAGMMTPLVDDLALSGAGIDTNSGMQMNNLLLSLFIKTLLGILELTISPILGNALSISTSPFTIVKQTDPPAGSSYDVNTYNAEWFRFYNDGYFNAVSVINGISVAFSGTWS